MTRTSLRLAFTRQIEGKIEKPFADNSRNLHGIARHPVVIDITLAACGKQAFRGFADGDEVNLF